MWAMKDTGFPSGKTPITIQPAPTPNNANRPNPNLLWVFYLSTNTNSSYNGGTVQIKHRFTHGYLAL